MLEILRRQGHRLPKDSRTLLQTPKKVVTVEKCGGHYAYFGVASGILNVLSQHPGIVEHLHLCFNIDGVPLFKSSNLQMWPILCNFDNFVPFIVAIYCGGSKPNSVEDYLSDFLQELQQLQEDGVVHGGEAISLSVKAFICDAPARAFLKCIKNHNSYHSCERCTIRGTYDGRVVLGAKEPDAVPRTEDCFTQLVYDYHQVKISPLSVAGISCIHGFSLDYMHLVCLGVVRRMLHFMKQGPNTCKLSFQQRSRISDHLKSLNGKLPREFSRQPRGLQELDRWKATEFRQFLLYTGPVVLRDVLAPTVYKHFLALTVVMSILLNSDDVLRNEYLGYARDLTVYFVEKSEEIYGKTFAVYNVHSLTHLPDNVEHFQCSLNNVSSFPFENYLWTLKKMVRQSRNPIAQVAKRLTELEKSTTHRGVAVAKEMFTCVSTTLRDGCFLLDNKDFAFVKEKRSDGSLVCDVIQHNDTESFFDDPCDSRLLNIVRVRDLSRAKRQLITRHKLHRKVVCLPLRREATNSGYVLFPMLHGVERS
ncbi:uncharacterized protein LOC121690429 isoform X2 [Alosa sapidissima]|nr:uncharacterized protein LOC121690429 isoform X2 [Alosa sapidissima]XP_041926914.1 uncharacterized protein LOC121690429 isoform X2 [Alosa sapidissima]